MTTTDVDKIINCIPILDEESEEISEEDEDETENLLSKKVTDLSQSLKKRINSLEKYHSLYSGNSIEIIRTLSSMYQMSGSKLIEQFFFLICTQKVRISSFLKVEAAKCLLSYEDTEKPDDERLAEIKENNEKRKILGYKALSHICKDLSDCPSPFRVQSIFLLMKSPTNEKESEQYFAEFLTSDNIECEFRYSSILSLEKEGSEEMKKEIYEYSSAVDENIEIIRSILNTELKKGTPIRRILRDISYDDIRKVWKTVLNHNRICRKDWFIERGQLAFFFYKKNPVYYRNISGQYLLKRQENELDRNATEKQILEFAEDTSLDYNLRADSADILLKFGSDEMKEKGRAIIMQLGRSDSSSHRTVFDNAQNVHTETVEESVSEILQFLSSFSINVDDFSKVNSHIEKMLEEKMKETKKDSLCKCKIYEADSECKNECSILAIKNEKIKISLRRILIDRALYSKFNNSLLNILLKVYKYIQTREDESIKLELYKRLLQELEEMSGTCSSGFASRLVNTISGFEDLNIRISYEDQVIANVAGRLNCIARKIKNTDSIFRTSRLEDVVEIWLLAKERKVIRDDIEMKLALTKPKPYKIRELVDFFLNESDQLKIERIEECINNFEESVLNEMMITSSKYSERQNFNLFFRTIISYIREELANEFKDLISDTDFDLYFRKSLMSYDGIMN